MHSHSVSLCPLSSFFLVYPDFHPCWCTKPSPFHQCKHEFLNCLLNSIRMAVSLDGVKHKYLLLYLIKEMESSFDLSPFFSTLRIDQIFKFVAINIIKVVFLFMPKLARKWINAVGPISSSFMVKLILFMVKIIIIGRSIVFAYICFIYVFILIP